MHKCLQTVITLIVTLKQRCIIFAQHLLRWNCVQSDLATLYLKAGLKNVSIMFLMTDSQVADEKFLVLINDMLASGEIPELFADDEVDNIISAIAAEVNLKLSIFS